MTCPAPALHSALPLSPRSRFTLRAFSAAVLIASAQAQVPPPTGTETTQPSEPAVAASAAYPVKKPATADSSAQWQTLNPGQQHLLAALEGEWSEMDPSRKGKWLELAARYPSLPADEQLRVQERISSWAKLSPAERQQARLGFRAARELKADERQAKWEAYQALPTERRQELADKAAQKLSQPGGGGKPGARPATKSPAPPTATPLMVPVLPKNQPELPLGPTLLQAKPGASTVLISQGKGAQRPTGRAKPGFDASLVDSATLLPKPARPRASDNN
ncbi:DUF3106 domain-containing protein [Paucibacter sp. PLA-PC-4]|uniref:DUF3106 domain-containing protein n=1 Tax=Paucibacter sp. PLA-PC-4 TaxID=2993655 RepID=UPI0022495137|nr:DUF3106 domain-containing protein [Paucibacter sp. PLA-PC-4]MCX2862605.1 DUF3106 domain-containing protein [Paucibacter sp. PLA-PC-4]